MTLADWYLQQLDDLDDAEWVSIVEQEQREEAEGDREN